MSVPDDVKKELMAEFEKGLEEVRSCPMTFGSLEPILARSAERMARLTQEKLTQAASHEADFPPSGVSALRQRETISSQEPEAAGDDSVGADCV